MGHLLFSGPGPISVEDTEKLFVYIFDSVFKQMFSTLLELLIFLSYNKSCYLLTSTWFWSGSKNLNITFYCMVNFKSKANSTESIHKSKTFKFKFFVQKYHLCFFIAALYRFFFLSKEYVLKLITDYFDFFFLTNQTLFPI